MYKSIITSAAVALVLMSVSCKSHVKDPVYGNIAYEGAELFSAPSATDKIGELKYGEIVEYAIDPSSAYAKIRNIATGDEGYVDTLKINKAQYPLESPELAQEEQIEPFLLNIETVEGGEVIEGLAFWKDGENARVLKTTTLAYNDGRVSTIEKYYIATVKPGYLLITEEVAYGENSGEKLDTPIIIYEDVATRAGVFEDGKCFTPGGQAGGFDTDDWE